MMAEGRTLTENLDFQQAIVAQNIRKVVTWACLFIFVIAGSAAAYPEEASIFFKRLIGLKLIYPSKTELFMVNPPALIEGFEAVTPYGKSLTVKVRADKEIPDNR